jgi:ATP-dependent protease ClpP protease subunit
MNRSAEMMIHDPWALAIGNARDMRETADQLDKVATKIASIYAARCGGDVEDWRNAMLDDTWYSPEEAVKAGLADEVIKDDLRDAKKAKNRFDPSIFNHAGREKGTGAEDRCNAFRERRIAP